MTRDYSFYIPEGVQPITKDNYGFNKYTIRDKQGKIAIIIENSLRGINIYTTPKNNTNSSK